MTGRTVGEAVTLGVGAGSEGSGDGSDDAEALADAAGCDGVVASWLPAEVQLINKNANTTNMINRFTVATSIVFTSQLYTFFASALDFMDAGM